MRVLTSRAELGLLGVGHLDVLELLRALQRAAELAELFRGRRRNDGGGQRHGAGENDCRSTVHAVASFFTSVRTS